MVNTQPQHSTKELASRKLWVFTCAGCTKRRRVTFSRGKAANGLCRTCRAEALERRRNENQLSLFREELHGPSAEDLEANQLMISDPANVEKWNPEPISGS